MTITDVVAPTDAADALRARPAGLVHDVSAMSFGFAPMYDAIVLQTFSGMFSSGFSNIARSTVINGFESSRRRYSATASRTGRGFDAM